MKKTLAILASLISLNSNAEVINVVATSTPPANCREGEPYDIYGYHEIHVINASYQNETIPYSYQLCMDGICDNAQNITTVYPQQRWDNSRVSHIRVRMAKGTHEYIVRTECGNEKTYNSYTIKVR